MPSGDQATAHTPPVWPVSWCTGSAVTASQTRMEYQNDFTSEGGILHGVVETVMDKTNTLANTKRALPLSTSWHRRRATS